MKCACVCMCVYTGSKCGKQYKWSVRRYPVTAVTLHWTGVFWYGRWHTRKTRQNAERRGRLDFVIVWPISSKQPIPSVNWGNNQHQPVDKRQHILRIQALPPLISPWSFLLESFHGSHLSQFHYNVCIRMYAFTSFTHIIYMRIYTSSKIQ